MKRRTLVAAAGILAIAGSIPLSALAAEKTIVVGVTAGPHAEIMEVVKRIAEKQGMKIRIVEFNDFVQPNAALVAGDLDINSFQHKPYMDQQNEDRGYKLASAAPTITFPLTYYTRKGYKTLADLPQGARGWHSERSDERQPRPAHARGTGTRETQSEGRHSRHRPRHHR